MLRILLPIIALLGAICVGIGIYLLVRPNTAQPLPPADEALVIQGTDSTWHSLGHGPFSVEVTGGLDYGNGNSAGPNGSLKIGDKTALVEGQPFGSPVYRIGSGKPSLIGNSKTFDTTEEVFVAINDSYYADNKGAYTFRKTTKAK